MTLGIGKVELTISTGNIAQVSVSSGRGQLAIVGPSEGGTANSPTPITRKSTLLSTFGDSGRYGPMVEAGAYALAYEVPSILAVRTDTTGDTDGAYSAITETSVGGTVTADGTVKPADDYEAVVIVTTGFTVGTTGGYYKYSLDGGRKFSAPIALGTATSITLPYGGGKYNLTSGHVWLADEQFSLTTTAPKWSSDALVDAIESLRDTSLRFGTIEIVGPFASSGEITAVKAALLDLRTKVKYRRAIGHFRARNAGETASAYATAFGALVSTIDCDTLCLTPSWYAPSAVNVGAVYVRPYSFHAAARQSKIREDISASSRTEWGSGTGQIRGSDGMVLPRAVDEADQELWTPLRGFAPRTWADKSDGQIYAAQGVTLAAEDSDTQFMRVAQVLDLAAETAYGPLADRVGRGLLPGADNLTLDKQEQQRIEEDVSKILKRRLADTNIAVGARLVLDNGQTIVGTPPIVLTGKVLVKIKGYVDEFEVEVAVDVTPTTEAAA